MGFKNYFKENLKESELTRDDLFGVNNDLLSGVKGGYYDISDGLHDIVDLLKTLSKYNKGLESEYKIFKKIKTLFDNSNLGKVL